jgi:phospholipid transport system substrate-binding protein
MFRFAYRRHCAAAIIMLVSGLATAAHGAQMQDAATFIADLGARGIQTLGPSVPDAQRQARFRQLLDSDFDVPEIARFALGPYARTMSPAAQQEFLPLFRNYIARAYSDRLGRYGGALFRVTGVRPYGGETVVATEATGRAGNPVHIEWHVADRGGRLLVTDVVVDGVSMKATQRGEFASIIQRNGGHPEALIAALRQEAVPPR